MSLLKIKNLKTYFHTRAGINRAVDDISFSIDKGEIVGVVGESGSGKSVTCHTMLGLLPQPPAKVEGGSVTFDNEELLNLPQSATPCNQRKADIYDLSGSYELSQPIPKNS
jgi:ABC-type dipeptide/oligopeptide/nickel transport system ATPase component